MLNQIMKLASENGTKQFEVLEQVTNNIANFNTSGYKVQRFEQYLTPDGRLEGAKRVDYSPGPIMVTRRDLDVAIDGDGFLPVTQPDGRVAYTRDGSFARNSEGFLVTQRGDLVGEGIQLPVNYEKVQILPNGTVNVLEKGQQTPTKVGQLTLVGFTNPEGLKNIGYNKVVPTQASGEAYKVESPAFKQGSLERSNVVIFQQVDQVLRLNASVISNLRIIKYSDDVYRQSVNLRQ